MRTFTIILGLIVCSILIFNWVNALGEIEVGYYTGEPEGAFTGGWQEGDSPEVASEKRSQVNSTYGLWLAVVVGVTGGLFYIANEKDKKTKELKTWYETEGKKEVEELLMKENNVNSHVEEEQDTKKPDRKEIIECPYCLEDIYAGAVKCKHCKTDLTNNG